MPFDTLGKKLQLQAEAKQEHVKNTLDAATLANTQVSTNFSGDDYYNAAFGNLVQGAAFATDKLGLEDTSKNIMGNYARQVGINEDLNVNYEGTDAVELAKYIAPSALGTSMFNTAISGLGKTAAKETSMLVAKESLKSKIAKGAGELGTQNLVITAGDVVQGSYSEEGELKVKTGDTADFAKMYGMNLMGDALFTMGTVSVAAGYVNGMTNVKKRKSFDGKNYSEYNLDKDAHLAINSTLLGTTDEGKIKPTYYTDEATGPSDMPVGSNYSSLKASGEFTGVITDGVNYARKDSDGNIVEATSRQSLTNPEKNTVEFPEDSARDVNGMMTLDTFNNIMKKSYKTLDEIKEDVPYSVVDKDGNFRTSTESQGDIRGKVFGNGKSMIDLKKSNLTKNLYGMTYQGKHVVRGLDDNAAAIMQAFGNMSKEDTAKFFTDYAVEFDASGNLVPNHFMDESNMRRFGEEHMARYVENDPGLKQLEMARPESFTGESAVGGTRLKNPYSQVLLAKSVSDAISETDLGVLRKYTESFNGTFSTFLESAMKEFESNNMDKSSAKINRDFYNYTENPDGSVIFEGLKPEFKKALDASYAISLAKMVDENGLIEPKQLSTGVVNGAFDILGVKPDNIHAESLKKNFADSLNNDAINHTLTEGPNVRIVDESGNTGNRKMMNKDLLESIQETFGKEAQERSYTINNIINHGTKAEKRGWIVSGERGTVKNKFMIDDDMDPLGAQLAETMRNTRYDLDTEGHKLIDSLYAMATSVRGTQNKFTNGDLHIGMYVGMLKPEDIRGHKKWNPAAKDKLRDRIDQFRKEAIELDNIRNMYSDEKGVYFDVERDINSRVRYMGAVNPQSSKLFLTTFHTEDSLFSLNDGIGVSDAIANGSFTNKKVELAYRSMLLAVGVKVEGIHDAATIQSEFRKLANQLLDKNGNIKTIYRPTGKDPLTALTKLSRDLEKAGFEFEKSITSAVLTQISHIAKGVRSGSSEPFKLFSEIDAKLSGVANTFAMLGLKDATMGLGSRIDTTTDFYTILADRLGISRSEAKPPVTGNNYLASDFASANAYAEIIIDNMLKNKRPKNKELNNFLKMLETFEPFQKAEKNIGKRREYISLLEELAKLREEGRDISERLQQENLTGNISNQLKALIETEQNNPNRFFGANPYHLVAGYEAMKSGERVSEASYEALKSVITQQVEKELGKALKDLYKGENSIVLQYRKDMAKFTDYMKEAFAVKYNEPAFKEAHAISGKIVDILKQLDPKKIYTDNQINNIKQAAANDAGSASTLSLRNLINGIAAEGYLHDGIYGIKEMTDIIPAMSIGNGKKIPMITIEGYAGYQNSVNYRTASPIDVFAPVFTIAHDAMIAAQTVTDKVSNLSDAIVGANSIPELGKQANQQLAGIIRDSNPYEIMMATMSEAIDDINGYRAGNDDALYWLKQQELAKANKHASPEFVKEALQKDGKKTLDIFDNNKVVDFDATLNTRKGQVDTNKKNNYSDADAIVDNYSLGMDSNVATIGDAATITHDLDPKRKGYTNSKDYFYIIEAMKSIESGKALDIGRLYDTHGNKNVAAHDITVTFESGAKSKAYTAEDANGNIATSIVIGHDKFTPDALRTAVHEFAHSYIDHNPHLVKELQSSLMELSADGKLAREDGSPLWGALGNNEIVSGEPLANVMHDLYTNELLMNNYKEFGKAMSETDLAKDLRGIVIDGATIYTTKDLQKYFEKRRMLNEGAQISGLARGMSGAMNSSVDLLAWMNGKEREKFQTVVQETKTTMSVARDAIAKSNSLIGELGFTDLFTLDVSKDAIELMASMKTGTENHLEAAVASIQTQLAKELDYPDSTQLDGNIGKLALNGVTKFLKEFEQNADSETFIKAVNENINAAYKQIKTQFQGNQSLVTRMNEGITALAYGKSKITAQQLADSILKEAYPVSSHKVLDGRKAMKDYIVKAAAAKRINDNSKAIGGQYSAFKTPEMRTTAQTLLNMLETQYGNDKTLFNTNIQYDLAASNRRAYLTPSAEYKGKSSNVLGQSVVNGVEYKLVANKDNSNVVGAQDSHAMDFDLNTQSYGIYSQQVNDGLFILTPEAVNTKATYADTRISTMLTKNAYTQLYSDLGRDTAFRQFEMLKDAGVLVTEARYKKLDPDTRKIYKRPFAGKGDPLGKDKNPFNEMFGGHYYNKKWEHYLEGSKGFDVGTKAMSKVVGKELAPFVSAAVTGVIGLVKALKGPLLVYRPSSYINNAVSNWMIYTVNSSDPLSPKKRLREATAMVDEYKKLARAATQIDLDPAVQKKATADLKAHPLHFANMHGLSSTIRSDAYKVGTYQENVILSRLTDVTGDPKLSNAMKTLLADPQDPWGAKIGSLFDKTEMLPKVMMYMAEMDTNGGNAKQAIQKVLLAFPTYNNLGPILNAVDQISPYTKYMANYPKMLRYSVANNLPRLAAMNALFLLGVRATYGEEIDQDEAWWYDQNYVNVFGIGYKAYESANPYWIPSKSIDGFGIVDFDFPVSAINALTTPEKYLPFTLPGD